MQINVANPSEEKGGGGSQKICLPVAAEDKELVLIVSRHGQRFPF